ncbi:MAG TPA: response regulator [Candidatus Choladousia intestinigallinarum]|nr:response regulator [Candidatus Choladousia intestinigallinarum]
MIRTLIVDDEFLIRYSIQNAVDWNSLGYEIIGEAENGPEALTQIKNLHPDLVLLDINLPILDGIEVCRQLKEQHINTEVIILTGYDDFKYIQSCLRLGVLNYVVKPLEEQEMTEALLKAKQTISIKKNIFQHAKIQPDLPGTDETLQSLYEKINPICSTEPVYLALAEIDYLIRENPSSSAQSVLINCAADAIVRFSREHEIQILCTRLKNRLLLSFIRPLSPMEHSLSAMQKYLHSQLGLSVSFGLCAIPLSPGQMAACIEIAADALAQKFHGTTTALFTASNPLAQNTTLEINSSKLYSFLLKAQGRDFLEYVDETLGKAIEIRLNKNNFILLCAGIINTILNYSSSQGITMTDSQKNQFRLATYLDDYETAAEIKSELTDACSSFILQYIKKPRMNPLVREIIEYADAHYDDPTLSSGKIAREISVSPNYLSKIFRQELDITITEYITRKRISEAVRLIETSDILSITDLAHAVGYNDSFYFSKIFHKLKGISPSNYIEMEKAKKA